MAGKATVMQRMTFKSSLLRDPRRIGR